MTHTPDQLLESIRGLPDDQVEKVAEQVLRLNASRRSPSLSPEETHLLKEINQPLPSDRVARYRELVDKRDAETWTPAEHGELCRLSDWLEKRNAERLARVAELARLRGATLSQTMGQLGLSYLVDAP